ncbi:MAG TPA: hypothetical protein VM490_21605, partial [Armatimonadaceae bacterium]|nr:hypothetical protein [Armatimonadaceae bacterium]
GRGAGSLLYQNPNDAFPDWEGRDLKSRIPGLRMIPLAMDGATAATVRFAQVPKLREMNVRAGVATLTLGAGELLAALVGGEQAARRAARDLREHGHALLAELRRDLLLPDAPLALANVPDPSDGADAHAAEAVALLNDVAGELASAHGAALADLHARFLGHGSRAAGKEGRASEGEQCWYGGGGLIEPNAAGANAIRATFWDALAQTGFGKDTTNT